MITYENKKLRFIFFLIYHLLNQNDFEIKVRTKKYTEICTKLSLNRQTSVNIYKDDQIEIIRNTKFDWMIRKRVGVWSLCL